MRIAIVLAITTIFGLCFTTPAAASDYGATLDGSQVVPPVTTTASGVGGFDVDGTKMFLYNISFGGLTGTETAAHVHGPASAGQNGPVIFDLPLGAVKFGSYGPLTAQEEADLAAGLWYVSIETSAYPAGEIRGQILSVLPVEEQTWGSVKELYRVE